MAKVDMKEMILIFIGVMIGLALTVPISGYAQEIVDDANSSDILVLIAPYIPVMWIVSLFGIVAAIGYSYYKK